MIAATAMANNLPVYTCNPVDFTSVDGSAVSTSGSVITLKANGGPMHCGRRGSAYAWAVLYELWDDGDGGLTFCLAGPQGDSARALLPEKITLVWSVEAGSHLNAMTAYYEHMGWGKYAPERIASGE